MDIDASDGRIYLPKRYREKYGTKFELIDRGDRLILLPVPENPLQVLREEVATSEKSVKELKDAALAQALEDAGT